MAKILIAVMAALAIVAGLALTVSEEGQAQQTDTPTPTESATPAPSDTPTPTAEASSTATDTTSASVTPTFAAPLAVPGTGGEAGGAGMLPTLALLAGASMVTAGMVLLATAWKKGGSGAR